MLPLARSNPRTVTTGIHGPSLTECNLKKLNNPQSAQSTDSSERTLCDPETDNHAEYMTKDGDPVQFKRTPTPSPPPNVAIVRGPEKPCSAVIQTPEPHLCALGLRCTRWIESLNYHRIRVIHLNAAAKELRLPINPFAGESNNLTYLRNEAESVTSFLKRRDWQFDLGEVLKKIQSPEYWDTEKAFLKSSGCLEQRQKMEHAGSRKRNRTEQTAVGNDTAPKRRCLDQAQPLISERKKFSLDSASSLKRDKTPVTRSASLAKPLQLPVIASESAASGPGTKEISELEGSSKRSDCNMNEYMTRSVLSPIRSSKVSRAARKKLPPPRQKRSTEETAIEHGGVLRRSERISKLNVSTRGLGHTSLYLVRPPKVSRARRKGQGCV